MAAYNYDLSRLYLKDDGSWNQVETPYIKVAGTWKACHKVWLKNAGSWKEVHRTKHSADSYVKQSATDFTSNGTYTVPAGVRYLEIEAHGGGGSGGGGVRTGGAGDLPGHRLCPNTTWDYDVVITDYATGGTGGHGGRWKGDIEVRPDDVFTITIGQGNTSPGAVGSPLELHFQWEYAAQVGANSSGGDGSAGGNTTITGPGNTSITANGGAKGDKATITVNTRCNNYVPGQGGGYYSGYLVTIVNPSRAAAGLTSATSDNLVVTAQLTSSLENGSSAPSSNSGGNSGSNGKVTITPYKISDYTDSGQIAN